jgi:hypothetical protein
MSLENPLWGAPRIHGELLILGIEGRPINRGEEHDQEGGPPSQGWKTFLRNHAAAIVR